MLLLALLQLRLQVLYRRLESVEDGDNAVLGFEGGNGDRISFDLLAINVILRTFTQRFQI